MNEEALIRMMEQIYGASLNTVMTLSDILLMWAEQVNRSEPSNRSYKEMEKMLKKDEVAGLSTDSYDEAKELKARMEDYDITPVVALQNGEGGLLFVPSSQREQAQDIIDQYAVDFGSDGMVSMAQLSTYANGEVMSTTMSEEEGLLFAERCNMAGIPVNLQHPDEGKARICFGEKDAALVNRINFDLSVALATNPALLKQAKWKNKYLTAMINTAITGRIADPNGYATKKETLPEGSVFVDRNGNTMTFSQNRIFLSNGLGGNSVSRQNPEALKRCVLLSITQMNDPVMLTAQEAEIFKNMNSEEKERMILEKQRSDRSFTAAGRPVLSQEELQDIARYEQTIRQVEKESGIPKIYPTHEDYNTTVEIHLQQDGMDTPVYQQVSVAEAAAEYGLTKEETSSMSVSNQDSPSPISKDILDTVKEHYYNATPEEVLDVEREVKLDQGEYSRVEMQETNYSETPQSLNKEKILNDEI